MCGQYIMQNSQVRNQDLKLSKSKSLVKKIKI